MSSPTSPSRKRAHSDISNPDPSDKQTSNKKARNEDSPPREKTESPIKSAGSVHRVDSAEVLESSAQAPPPKNAAAAPAPKGLAVVVKKAAVKKTTATRNGTDDKLKRLEAELEKARPENTKLKEKVEGYEQKSNTPQPWTQIDEDRLMAAKQGRTVPPQIHPAQSQQKIQELEKKITAQDDMIKNQAAKIREMVVAQKDFTERFNVANGAELRVILKAKDAQMASDAAALAEIEKRVKQQDEQLETLLLDKSLQDQRIKTRDADINDGVRLRKLMSRQLDEKNDEAKKANEERAKTMAVNVDLEKSVKAVFEAKAGYKKTIANLEEHNKDMKKALQKKDGQLKSIGERCAKRVSFIAQTKQVLRCNNIDLPKPLPGMEFSDWKDDKGPEEAVKVFMGGK
ncbi:uncharacterized protein CLAFUR5_03661 [Fulvia fulva]|uniref:Uncharacterized protein n=1 Tax=Passalora fulva TaxID=5499 RepID=A0A9Q8P4L5_PASFU|nr:uncharacterized protein CLAFUR5_03661 [Fulvia fulva]KAK4632578.1 hypothetical protein CLAFUR0_03674 [Fulvia fulva]UJO13200.1 hypothetical protein CLAFUR5_03661 [Fulvia fulva]